MLLAGGGGGTALAARAAPASGIISTVAGGVGGPGPGTGISLSDANAAPGGCSLSTVAFAAGSLYIADGSVRKVSARTGLLTTPAGTGAQGPVPPRNNKPLAVPTRVSSFQCATSIRHWPMRCVAKVSRTPPAGSLTAAISP